MSAAGSARNVCASEPVLEQVVVNLLANAMNHATVRVLSAPGEGATFTIELPIGGP
ncbi:hypothetical protein ACSRUE_36605 [Sorangium sp. KYC3313]|uniref:hypothetical protein n=1 Tax=Sorangium sp. KYC3313 TaxID=3449740 RepID=UPI003F8B0317